MLTTILIIIIVAALLYLLYFIYQRLPDLKNLDITSIAEENQKVIKEKILQAKLSRSTALVKEKLNILFSPHKKFVVAKIKKISDRIVNLEKKYQIGGKSDESLQNKTIAILLQEAEDFINQEEYSLAEKNLIEVISRDRKNFPAYELLGGLYVDNKNYDQAEEIYKYLLKLSAAKDRTHGKMGAIGVKKDQAEEAEMELLKSLNVNNKVALYYDNLAQVYAMDGKQEKALDCYLKAIVIEPSNPKYLDKLIESSIAVGDRGLAKRTLNQLKKINPENGKLTDFTERIEKI